MIFDLREQYQNLATSLSPH